MNAREECFNRAINTCAWQSHSASFRAARAPAIPEPTSYAPLRPYSQRMHGFLFAGAPEPVECTRTEPRGCVAAAAGQEAASGQGASSQEAAGRQHRQLLPPESGDVHEVREVVSEKNEYMRAHLTRAG